MSDMTDGQCARDLTVLSVAPVGRVARRHGVPGVVLINAAGAPVQAIEEFLCSMAANGSPASTLYSYACSLLRWWRFLAAVRVGWERASRVEVRDFVLWLRFGPVRPGGYAPATINHSLAVVRSFYEERATVGEGPVVNPVPGLAGRDADRPHAHHNPMEPFARSQRAPLRQRNPTGGARGLGDAAFNDLFLAMRSDRDRALLAFYVSTGARAVELLGLTVERVDAANQTIGVYRKGTGRLQWLPASPDAFVWWRLYEARLARPPDQRAVWLTRRAPIVALSYPAMRRVLQRANTVLGAEWTLHDLRHTAARRLIADPAMSLIDVQWVLGHAHLSTTAIYLRPDDDEMIAKVRAHQQAKTVSPSPAVPVGGYRPEVLDTLLGATGRGR
jgi:site-specific recombinase XerD